MKPTNRPPFPTGYSQPLTRRRALGHLLAPAALGLLGAGCAAPGPTTPAGDDRAALLERARAYWSATQANDQVTAWSHEDVSLDPRWTLQAYLKRGGIQYESVLVKGIRSLEGDTAVVEVEVRFSLPQVRLRNQVAVVGDRWRRIDGRWYHVLGRHSLFDDQR
jgi:hypothetical protein